MIPPASGDPFFNTLRRLFYFSPLRYIHLRTRFEMAEPGVLMFERGSLARVMSLGLYHRTVMLDSARGVIFVCPTVFLIPEIPKSYRFEDVERFDLQQENLFDSWVTASDVECFTLQARLSTGELLYLAQWTGNFHHPETDFMPGIMARDTSAPRTEAQVALALCNSLLESWRARSFPS